MKTFDELRKELKEFKNQINKEPVGTIQFQSLGYAITEKTKEIKSHPDYKKWIRPSN